MIKNVSHNMFLNSNIPTRWTLFITQVWAHELGHNFGAHHNIEEDTNSNYPYGHGHLIGAGNGVEGSTTILAYTRTGHRTRANYYSNPDLVYPPTGTPLGVRGVSNNARLFTENREVFAAIGDESGECKKIIKCSDGFQSFNGNCYKFFEDKKSWDGARETCQSLQVK